MANNATKEQLLLDLSARLRELSRPINRAADVIMAQLQLAYLRGLRIGVRLIIEGIRRAVA